MEQKTILTDRQTDRQTDYGERINRCKALCELGVGGQRGIVYYPFGVCPTLSATQYKDPEKIMVRHGKQK